MKIINLAVSILLSLGAAANAVELPSSGFGYAGIGEIRQAAAPVPAIKTGLVDRIDQGHLLAQGGKHVLFGYADTDAQYKEAVAAWTQVLAAAGVKAGAATFENGMYQLPYETADGSVIRQFLAEARQFKPKDEASLRENQAMVLGALHQRGVRVLGAYVVGIPELLPTYAVYYFTKEGARQEDENRLRVLGRGDDIDFDLLQKAGVDILQKPETWMMVYVGREVGQVSRIAKDDADAQAKLKDRVDWLVSQGKVMIGTKIEPLTEPYEDYTRVVEFYFYQ